MKVERWKLGDEWLPYRPSASHVPPGYRDGWNDAYAAAQAIRDAIISDLHCRFGLCNHCGRRDCYGRESGTTLPRSVATQGVLDAINSAFGKQCDK